MEDGEPVRQFETVRLRKDGEPIQVAISLAPIRNARGQVLAICSIASDITSRKRAEMALEESNAQLRRFNEATIDRELQMIALKKEINALAAKLGRPPPHCLDFMGARPAEDTGQPAHGPATS